MTGARSLAGYNTRPKAFDDQTLNSAGLVPHLALTLAGWVPVCVLCTKHCQLVGGGPVSRREIHHPTPKGKHTAVAPDRTNDQGTTERKKKMPTKKKKKKKGQPKCKTQNFPLPSPSLLPRLPNTRSAFGCGLEMGGKHALFLMEESGERVASSCTPQSLKTPLAPLPAARSQGIPHTPTPNGHTKTKKVVRT